MKSWLYKSQLKVIQVVVKKTPFWIRFSILCIVRTCNLSIFKSKRANFVASPRRKLVSALESHIHINKPRTSCRLSSQGSIVNEVTFPKAWNK